MNKEEYRDDLFNEIFLLYKDTIARICLLQCRKIQDAEDCFQDTFLEFYLTDKKFQSNEHIKAWLIRVALNKCHSVFRTAWKKKVVLQEKDGDYVFAEEPEDGIERLLEQNTLWQMLSSLDRKYSKILYLYYYEEYDTREIAGLISESVNTVKSRLRRGRKLLAERYGENNEK